MSSEDQDKKQSNSGQPSVGRLAVPVWIFIVTLLLGYRGCMHIDQVGGDFAFRSDLFEPYRSPKELEGVQPVVDDGGYRKGEALFNVNCAPCHQSSGLGTPGVFPPLAGSDWVLAEGPNRIIRIVLDGFTGQVTVSGNSFNNNMPPFGPSLSDEQISQILTYVRGSKPWGNKASQVTPEEVAAIRSAVKTRSQPWTAPELEKIPVK